MGIFRTIAKPFVKQRSLENPRIPLSSERIMEYLGSGNESYSGANVSRDTSLGLSAFWRGVNLISNTLAKIPLDVYKRVKDDGREIDAMHNAQWLLHHQPNKVMTPFVFKKTCQAHVLTHGNSVSWLFAPTGTIEEILPLDPECTWMDGDWYVTRLGEKELRLAKEEVLHLKGLSHDGHWGLSVIEIMREVIGHGIALQRYGNVFFRNNAAPKVVIKLPLGKSLKTQEAVERLRESWGRVHAGLDNAHKPAILEDGTDVTPFNISNEDIQFLESKKFSLIDMANVFGLQPHKLGDSARTSYASLEQENQAFLDDTMDPWFVTWEQECMAKLFSYGERLRDKRYIEFKRQALMRTDFNARTQAYHNLLQDGVMCRDEVRKLENLNPIPDGEGAKFFFPLNLGIVGETLPDTNAGETKQTITTDDKQNDAPARAAFPLEDVLRLQHEKANAEVQRFWRRVSEHAKRAAKKPQKFHEWLDVYLVTDNRDDFFAAMRPIVSTVSLITRGSTGNDTQIFVDNWFSSMRQQLNELTGQVTAEQLETRVTAYFTDTQPRTFGGTYAT